ncbi:hypothetical protein V6N13_074419 [Hibiscus sabdariffa]
MAGDDSVASLYRVLADQCLSLEANHAKLREEFDELVQQDKTSDKEVTLVLDSIDSTSYPISWTFPGYFSTGSPFRNVLESIGHAIHVSSAASGRITFCSYTGSFEEIESCFWMFGCCHDESETIANCMQKNQR